MQDMQQDAIPSLQRVNVTCRPGYREAILLRELLEEAGFFAVGHCSVPRPLSRSLLRSQFHAVPASGTLVTLLYPEKSLLELSFFFATTVDYADTSCEPHLSLRRHGKHGMHS